MTQVTIAEVQRRLSELLSAAEAGETVTIRSGVGRTFTLAVQRPECRIKSSRLKRKGAGGMLKAEADSMPFRDHFRPLSIPLDLEASYEETCRLLRIIQSGE